jgi:hypothetical protein
MNSMRQDRATTSPAPDGRDDLREWRWRSYLDHLEDLGYDLGLASAPDDRVAVGPGTGDRPSASPSSSPR